jgi:hypothetical protein
LGTPLPSLGGAGKLQYTAALGNLSTYCLYHGSVSLKKVNSLLSRS